MRITETRIKALVAEALQDAAEYDDDHPDPDIYLRVFPKDKTRKGMIGGWYVPDTDKKMFVHRVKSPERMPGWAITHTPTMRRLLCAFLIEMPEALQIAKACYDAAITEGVPIASDDQHQLAGWPAAIGKHVPEAQGMTDIATIAKSLEQGFSFGPNRKCVACERQSEDADSISRGICAECFETIEIWLQLERDV